MACLLTKGRNEPCKDVVGGITAVYFADFGTLGAITYDGSDTDVIDAIGGDADWYKFQVKGNSSFEQAVTSSRENGTTFFEQTLNLNFKKLSKQTHNQLKLLAYARPHVVVEDNNGNKFMMGLDYGADISGGTIVTGAAMGDMSGYTLVFTAQEKIPANFIDATITAEAAVISDI
tara:strand:+ start:248 stop:772 length:525 start_codon:yes stop_codon:yes gene_type:complete